VPAPYQVWLRKPCYDYLAKQKAHDRGSLLAWLESMGSDFSRAGDFKIRGDDGRDWQVAFHGVHTVIWWVDHAACEVRGAI